MARRRNAVKINGRSAGQGGARKKGEMKMPKDKYYGKTLRKNFARHEEVMPMPNLLEIQKKSYQEFLDTGLREVFSDVGAITDYQGNLELTFIDYKMDEAPKYDVEVCRSSQGEGPSAQQGDRRDQGAGDLHG